MAIVACKPFVPYTRDGAIPFYGVSTYSLTAANHACALVTQPAKSGELKKIRFHLHSVTTSATMVVGFRTVDTNGHPTSTLYDAGCADGSISVTTAGWYEHTFTNSCTVTRAGSPIAIVVAQPGASAGSCVVSDISNDPAIAFPRGALNTGSWAKAYQMPNIVPIFDDNAPMYSFRQSAQSASAASTWFSLNSTPDEIGSKISLPFKHRVAGLVTSAYPLYSTADADFCIFRGDTELEAKRVNAVWRFDFSSFAPQWASLFDQSYEFNANESYRLSIRPAVNGGTGDWNIYEHASDATAIQSSHIAAGGQLFKCTRVNLGSWTDTATSTWVSIWPLIDGLDDGAGGGGGLAANPIGGYIR